MSAGHESGFQEQRRKRLEWLADYLQQIVPTDGIKYGEVKNRLLSRWGLTPEKTDEYMHIIIEAYGFELREGKIVKLSENHVS